MVTAIGDIAVGRGPGQRFSHARTACGPVIHDDDVRRLGVTHGVAVASVTAPVVRCGAASPDQVVRNV